MLFPNLFDQIGAISDNNILNPSIQGTSTNDGRMEVDPKIPPKPEMPSSQEKVFQPSGLPGVPEKKVWDGSQGSEFFDNSILLSSSEEKKSTQSVLPDVCEERIWDGPDEFDFSLESLIDQSDLQLQRARKKHVSFLDFEFEYFQSFAHIHRRFEDPLLQDESNIIVDALKLTMLLCMTRLNGIFLMN